MKLKRLLPIASVASVAAVVAPIVTSCGSGYTIDGKSIYIPKSAQAIYNFAEYGETGMSDDEGRDLYLESVKNNPDVYKEDVLCTLSAQAYNERHRTAINNGTGKVSNGFDATIKLNFTEIRANTEKKTISINVNGSIYINDCFEHSGENINIKHFSIEAKDMSFEADDPYVYNWDFDTIINNTTEVTTKVDGWIFTGDSLYSYDNDEFTFKGDDGFEKLTHARHQFIVYAKRYLGSIDCSYHMQNILSEDH